MTTQAERIRESHRGWRRAEPASQSRVAALETFGLHYVRVDDFNVIVEHDFQLNLAMSYWKATDGTSHGYLVSALDAEIRRQRRASIDRIAATISPGTELLIIDTFNSEKPAVGRDNVPAELEATELHQHVESTAGPTSLDVSTNGSASLLPLVSP